MIFGILFILCVLTILFGIAFKITGALLKAVFWMFVLLPIGMVLWGLGILLCCTILFIPIGISLLKAGTSVILPI